MKVITVPGTRPQSIKTTKSEWVELAESGWSRPVPPRSKAALLAGFHVARGSSRPVRPNGQGDAAQRIAERSA